MFDTRQLTIGAAGTGQKSWNLPGGFQIAGIRIDNPSGSWLVLPDGTFIPPYTLGFGHSFQPTISRLDVLFSVGPAGQVSTQQGDKPTVTIYSEPVGEAPGVPSGAGTAFIEQFTPYQVGTFLQNVAFSAPLVGGTICNGAANKRIRVLGIQGWADPNFGGNGPAESGCKWTIFPSDGSGVPFLQFHLTVRDILTYTIPTDYPVGASVNHTIVCDWADVFLSLAITFLLI
jgi:hypothetical protein